MKDYEKNIEIPFGAFDSELGGFEYTIPEGYEAEIKDGKVIVKKVESEDEKIKKYLLTLVNQIWADAIEHHGGVSKEQVIAYLERQGEQKPAWSEEDEKIRTRCAACLGYHYHDEMMTRKEYEEAHNWLESLKDRVQPQQKQEWSEDEERKIQDCVNAISKFNLFKTYYQKELIDWLKSLRPQSHWRPSDEQMKALRKASKNEYLKAEQYDILVLLYNDLKKLREE